MSVSMSIAQRIARPVLFAAAIDCQSTTAHASIGVSSIGAMAGGADRRGMRRGGLAESAGEPARSSGRGGDHPLATRQDPAGSDLLRLLRVERRWLLRIFTAILPSNVDPAQPRGAADVPLGRFIDDFVVHAPLMTLIGLRAALW